jgi:hypothetical protein
MTQLIENVLLYVVIECGFCIRRNYADPDANYSTDMVVVQVYPVRVEVPRTETTHLA